MNSDEFIIDNETIDILTKLLINERLYFWDFKLNGVIIKICDIQETGRDLFGYPITKKIIIYPNTLKTNLKGNTLMKIRDSIIESKPNVRYTNGESVNGLYMNISIYCDDIIRFLDNKIMEIKFNKILEENVKLKESINQLNDKFSILIDSIEIKMSKYFI